MILYCMCLEINVEHKKSDLCPIYIDTSFTYLASMYRMFGMDTSEIFLYPSKILIHISMDSYDENNHY